MTRTYYTALDWTGAPATKRQKKALGTPAYGYKTRARAELYCPNAGQVVEQHTNGFEVWGGRVVSYRNAGGLLHRKA